MQKPVYRKQMFNPMQQKFNVWPRRSNCYSSPVRPASIGNHDFSECNLNKTQQQVNIYNCIKNNNTLTTKPTI